MTKAEEYIKFYTKNCSNEMLFKNKDGSKLYHPWLTPDDALSAVEIAKEEMIERACKWLKDYKSPFEELGLHIFIDDGFINDLRNFLNE